MGGSPSKPTKDVTETKGVDSNGIVNNNFTVKQDAPFDVHSFEIIALLSVICGIKVFEFIYGLYKIHKKNLKKKYQNSA